MLAIVNDYKINYAYSNKNPERICCVEGCTKLGHNVTTTKNKRHGIVRRRKYCAEHYYKDLAERRGAKSFTEILARNKGMTITAYRRSNHEYRRHILNFCENIDGRLGYTCTTTIIIDCGMLHADHKNGVPWDHRPTNMQTLCSCCHSYKSHVFKDYASLGRKSSKKLTEQEKKKIIIEADKLYADTFKKFKSNAILGIS